MRSRAVWAVELRPALAVVEAAEDVTAIDWRQNYVLASFQSAGLKHTLLDLIFSP